MQDSSCRAAEFTGKRLVAPEMTGIGDKVPYDPGRVVGRTADPQKNRIPRTNTPEKQL
jgi:hypothetical protein